MLVELRHASTSYGILASPGRRVRTRATRVPAWRRGVEVCAFCALCALSPRIGRFGVFDCGPQSEGPSTPGAASSALPMRWTVGSMGESSKKRRALARQ